MKVNYNMLIYFIFHDASLYFPAHSPSPFSIDAFCLGVKGRTLRQGNLTKILTVISICWNTRSIVLCDTRAGIAFAAFLGYSAFRHNAQQECKSRGVMMR
jgi:hypothetical protein